MWLKFGDLISCGLDGINFWIGVARNLTYDSRTVALDLKKRTVFDLSGMIRCSDWTEIWCGRSLLSCECMIKILWPNSKNSDCDKFYKYYCQKITKTGTENKSLFWIYCEGSTGPKFLNLYVDDPCAVVELWSKFEDKRRTVEKIINHARAVVRTRNSRFCLLFLLIYSRAILRSSLWMLNFFLKL